jgi:hypothetical protein
VPLGLGLKAGAFRAESRRIRRRLSRFFQWPPTRCFRDSFPLEDSSAPCCINFFPPRRSSFPRKALFSDFLGFFFLGMAAHSSSGLSASMGTQRQQSRNAVYHSKGHSALLSRQNLCRARLCPRKRDAIERVALKSSDT